MQGALAVALTVALTRTYHLTLQFAARAAMLQQAELSYATLSLVCNRKGYDIVYEQVGLCVRTVALWVWMLSLSSGSTLGPRDLGLKQ